MGFRVSRFYEYDFQCDECGGSEVLHTTDYDDELDIFVHNTETARKVARFHKSKGTWICDDCWNNRRADA